ncbi:MAG: RelA/SpoT family protein [Dehalococcoidia bacterium]
MPATKAEITDLIAKAQGYLPPERVALLERAYDYADKAHAEQTRVSGGPYIEHPLHTAIFLADLRLDSSTLAAALLHDVIEDCGITFEQLKAKFGAEVARLVDGVTKLSRLDLLRSPDGETPTLSPEETHIQAESLRKMLLAMAEDIRVILIKLADRLHNMRTLNALPRQRRQVIAQETLDIYAPLAHRLGIWEIKWRLEDMAFRHLQPSAYRQISRMLAAKREEREAYVSQVAQDMKRELETAGIKAEVTGRPKHIYSIFRKQQKYATLGREVDQIYDLYALRVLVQTKSDCYNALGVIHSLWHPVPGQFDDYIANPKENLYQALHTIVMCKGTTPLEVQIRTREMHRLAEYGVAAHWHYKEGTSRDKKFDQKMTWLRQLLEWHREVSGAEEFLESVRMDIFRDQVFVYTPKGDIIELPSGATPIDFAYRIHTHLGHRCIGAKVGGKLVPLDYQLQSGDTVEILTSKVARGPSIDWLNPNLGYVHTAHAREKIRQWFRKQERSASVPRGRELLHRELKRLNMTVEEAELAPMFKFDTVEEFLAALGSGNITTNQVVHRLTSGQEERSVVRPPISITTPSPTIQVLGVGDLLTHIARCCSPIPGDEIVGYITRTRGVTVHRKSCPNVVHEDELERLVKVEWGPAKELYPVRISVVAWDRVGLLRDITTLVSQEGVNIASVVTTENNDATATITLTVHTTGIAQLSRLFSKLEGVQGVVSVTRVTESEPPSQT